MSDISNNKNDNSIENIKDYLERIKRINLKMNYYDDKSNADILGYLRLAYPSITGDDSIFLNKYSDYIEEIKKKYNRYSRIRKEISDNIEMYNQEYSKYEELLSEETKELNLDALLSDEERKSIHEYYLNKMISVNSNINKIQEKIETLRKEIGEIEKQINQEEKEFEYAFMMGITKNEYEDIMKTLKSKDVIEDILDSKGVKDIFLKDIKDRTPDEKEKLATARNSIRDEVAKIIANSNKKSALDTIQFLYNISDKSEQKEPPKSVNISEKDLNNITTNLDSLYANEPLKITGENKNNYRPHPAPKDMIDNNNQENNNERTIDGLRKVIIDLDKLIESHQGDVNAQTLADNTYFDELVKLKDKLDNLLNKPKQTIVENNDITQIQLSNKYDNLADERFELVKKYGENSKEVADIDKKLREISSKMQSKQNPSQEKEIIAKSNNLVTQNKNTDVLANIGINKFSSLPEHVEKREKKESKNLNKELKGLKDKITIYCDVNNGNKPYIRKAVFDRFFGKYENIEAVRINGALCYSPTQKEFNYIKNNKDNDYSPYDIEYVDINLNKKIDSGIKEITLYRAVDDNNQIYATEKILNMYGITPTEESIDIKGEPCHKITPEEDEIINKKATEQENPKMEVKYEDVKIKDKVNEENVVIYKAVDDNDQLYTTKEVFDKFGIPVAGTPTEILGKPCYKLSPEQDKIIKDKAKDSKDPIIHVIYKPVKIKKQEQTVEPHYQEVIRKITKDLDIKKKDGKRYRASNIKVWQTFKDELKSGNYIYNVVHFVPAVVKAGMNFIRKIAAEIMLKKRGREVTKEMNARLNGKSENKEYNLTEADLEVLWQHYKGRNLRADMNNQINPIIIQRLREYGLQKVNKINEEIKTNYLAVIAASDEIDKQKAKLEKMPEGKAKEIEKEKLKSLYKVAAKSVRLIEDKRKEADDLLSNGVHGIEEDFKAVESKMNYIGLRFSKQNDFDNELQDMLAAAGKRINTAKAKENDKELFEAFIDYEKIYYENTEVKGSIAGRRSTGKKWYSPLAEMMDYRDDPFIRDLFTTVATVSAAISIANGIVTHYVKENQLQQDIDATNKANLQYHNSVQKEVQNIQGQRQAEIEGIQAQMYKDVRDGFNTGERGILDKSNWEFGGSYNADDAILHSEADNLISSVQNQSNTIISQLHSGTISQSQAVEMFAQAESNLSTTINNALQPLFQASKSYAQGHQFAYDATLVPTEWFANHPNAFVDFGNAITAVNQSADTLSLLSPSLMQTIGSLPSDLATTIAAGISSLALVRNIHSTMKNKNNGKNIDHRNDELGQMFGEKIVGEIQEENKKHK